MEADSVACEVRAENEESTWHRELRRNDLTLLKSVIDMSFTICGETLRTEMFVLLTKICFHFGSAKIKVKLDTNVSRSVISIVCTKNSISVYVEAKGLHYVIYSYFFAFWSV
jgi:hypothetical protein